METSRKYRLKVGCVFLGVLVFSPFVFAGTTVYQTDFNSDTPGLNAMPSGWTISNGGTVDIIPNGGYGITCVGATGNCIDLDGTSGKSGDLTSPALNLIGGQTYTASFSLSGNQRYAGQVDVVSAGFGSAVSSWSLPGNAPWATQSISFAPAVSGIYHLSFLDNSSDNVGAILDNVSIQGVPEPASAALTGLGLAVIGLASRRRKAVLRCAPVTMAE